jgi:hypothetical protein
VICKIRSYNARQAELFGKEMDLIDRLVLVKSDPLTHTEFQFSERYGCISFSSTLQDGSKGCRFKDISYSHPEYWNTQWEEYTNDEEDRAYARAKALEGKEYDLMGAITFSPNGNVLKNSTDKYWCTEAVQECRQAAGKQLLLIHPYRYIPRTLFFELFYLGEK